MRFSRVSGCGVGADVCRIGSFGAQQTVDYASVSGRVTDPSGGVVPGARSPPAAETNVATHGRHRPRRALPLPVSSRRACTRSPSASPGFATHARLTLTVGAGLRAAGDARASAASTRPSTCRAEATVLEAARSQIAGTDLAGRGRARCRSTAATSSNSRCSCPASRRPTLRARSCSPRPPPCPASRCRSASQRNLSNNFIVDGLSANDDAAALSGITYGVDAVEQFQVVTSGGAGRARPRARRLRQHRHAQRHQRAARHRLRLHPRRQPQRARTRCRAPRCR